MKPGIRPDEKDDAAIEDGKIAHDPQHGLLLRADNVRGADKFRRTPEFGVNARSCYFGRGLAAPHQRPA